VSPIRREPRTGRASIARRLAAIVPDSGPAGPDPGLRVPADSGCVPPAPGTRLPPDSGCVPPGPGTRVPPESGCVPPSATARLPEDSGRVSPRPGGRPRSRARRALSAAALGLLVIIALSGCTNNEFTRLGWPDPITKQGKVMLTLWQGSWIAAFAVGAVVWGLIIWACIFHRKRSDELPPQVRYNLPIEIMYTVVPFIMIAVLFYFTARDENYVNAQSSRPAVKIDVTGFQWSWEFSYPQYKVPGSAAGQVTLTGRPYPGPLPLLVMPANETVKFTLNSLDVVHSFWIPEFVFKRDVIPNHTNSFQVTATKTGTFIGHCTELCGVYHSLMLFRVQVVTPQQFRSFMAAKQAQQKAGGVQ
jgi:cytochrome c oxidase subunit II